VSFSVSLNFVLTNFSSSQNCCSSAFRRTSSISTRTWILSMDRRRLQGPHEGLSPCDRGTRPSGYHPVFSGLPRILLHRATRHYCRGHPSTAFRLSWTLPSLSTNLPRYWYSIRRIFTATPARAVPLLHAHPFVWCSKRDMLLHNGVQTHKGRQGALAPFQQIQRARTNVAHQPAPRQTCCITLGLHCTQNA
jgi:hypothetical protein